MRKDIKIHSTQILRIAKFWIVMSAIIAIDGYGIFLLTGFKFWKYEVVRSVVEAFVVLGILGDVAELVKPIIKNNGFKSIFRPGGTDAEGPEPILPFEDHRGVKSRPEDRGPGGRRD